jgi:ceramide glucosyltransferase
VNVLAGLLLTATLFGIVYLAVALAVTLRFARRAIPQPRSMPNVTVLKPVAGLESALYENLASFCDQDYPDFEVIFCVHRSDDPGVAVIERVAAAFPQRARVAAGENPAYRNPKIANLATAAAGARGELIVIADSDVRVTRGYLRALAASFDDPHVGAATCLYRAIPGNDLISQLGAAYVEDQFAPSVLVAATLGTLRFCLGATMAVRRRVLDAIGGIGALGAFLADDHKLGELVTAGGYAVHLSRYVVATTIPETNLPALWTHELRWARTTFTLARAGYVFSFLMFPVTLALLYLFVSRNAGLGIALLALAVAMRVALHYVAARALAVPRTPAAWVAPLRDLLSFALWFTSLFGRSVRWRQAQIDVDGDGRMQ